MVRVRLALSIGIVLAVSGWAGCGERSCLRGELGCRVVAPCRSLAAACASDAALAVTTLSGAVPGGGHRDTLGGAGDVLLQNGEIEVVISGLGNQNYVDISGGAILDLRLRGQDNDALNLIAQTTGLLPDDQAQYDTLEILDERPTRVAVQLSGRLFHHPDRRIYTLYELRGCERQVRVRTEAINGSPDAMLWALADAYYWSGRSPVPFTPVKNGGFSHPSFDLLTIDAAYERAPYLAATAAAGPPVSYATVSCSQSELVGFHASQISAAGLDKTVVLPRDYVIFERVITVSGGPGIAPAVDQALAARAQLWGDAAATLSGRVAVTGASSLQLLVYEDLGGGDRLPWTELVPGEDGRFSARVPNRDRLRVEIQRFGRAVLDVAVPDGRGDRVLPDVTTLPSTTRVTVRVVDGDGQPLPSELYVSPSGDAAAHTGTFFSQYPSCAPLLGSFPGGSPACAMVLVPTSGEAAFELPEGEFVVYAFHGPFFTLAQQPVTALASGAPVHLDFALRDLGLQPAGAISADLHVHGAASFDSSIPDEDRVLAFVATGTDVLVATDHDVVYDYAQVASLLGVSDRLVTVAGLETTGHVPYLEVPGDPFPRVIGHYNFWPLKYQPGLPRNGGPFDELIEPGELFARALPLASSGVPIIQLNHPLAAAEFGRDLGFPKALHLSLLTPLPAVDDGTRGGMFIRTPTGGVANDAYHTQEVMNGSANAGLLGDRAFWFYMLQQGKPRTGTANSDTHSLGDNTAGSPRNLVFAATQKNSFAIDVFNQALRDGRSFGTNGPVIAAELRDGATVFDYGLAPIAPGASATLHLEVSAAPWVFVDEIRILVNGEVKRTITGAELTQPSDPFGTTGLSRFVGDVALAELLPSGARDAWIVIEAGRALPLFADLGGGDDNRPDGIPDTGDNNRDGRVDASDIKPGDETGPLDLPPAPPEDDPRRHFYKVMHAGYPYAFTNPFLLDRNGNGRFDSPAGAQ